MTFTPKPRKVLPMASVTADHHVHGPEIRERFAAAMRRCPVLHGSAKLVARAYPMRDGAPLAGGSLSEPGRRPSRFPGTHSPSEVMA